MADFPSVGISGPRGYAQEVLRRVRPSLSAEMASEIESRLRDQIGGTRDLQVKHDRVTIDPDCTRPEYQLTIRMNVKAGPDRGDPGLTGVLYDARRGDPFGLRPGTRVLEFIPQGGVGQMTLAQARENCWPDILNIMSEVAAPIGCSVLVCNRSIPWLEEGGSMHWGEINPRPGCLGRIAMGFGYQGVASVTGIAGESEMGFRVRYLPYSAGQFLIRQIIPRSSVDPVIAP